MLKSLWKFSPIVLIGTLVCIWTSIYLKDGIAENMTQHYKLIRTVKDVHEYELLSNGLKVLIKQDLSAPVVTVMVNYQVGSRHESDGNRGAAHLLEHMMFKGTERYQKQKDTSIAKTLQNLGAILNATTWTDGTNYYETIPNDQVEIALDIEADRMRGSLFREEDLASEMHVVHSELEKIENSPLTQLYYTLWRTAFEKHPYHHPVIGLREDIEATTAADLKRFYDTYYWPNNATLTVIGDFEIDEMLNTIEKYFGSVPKSPNAIPEMTITEPEQTAKRYAEIQRNDPIEASYIGFKSPQMTHEDIPTFEILSQVLSNGKTSRLYRGLVDTGLAVEARADASKSHDPGLFMTQLILAPGKKHEDIEKAALEIYKEISENGILTEELRNAKNQLRSQILFSRDGSFSTAQEMSGAISGGDWTFFVSYLDRIKGVTENDVQDLVKRYIREEIMTVARLVSKNPMPSSAAIEKSTVDSAESTLTPEPQGSETGALPSIARSSVELPPPPVTSTLTERIVQQNIGKIKTFSVQTSVDKVVTLTGSFDGGGHVFSKNPVLAALTVDMLDEGTQKRDKFTIAGLLESRGADLSFELDNRRTGFKARCLTEDVPLVIELIAEQLRIPAFKKQDFKKQKQRLQVELAQLMSSTGEQAQAALTRMIYPEDHPYYEHPFEKQLEALNNTTLEDVVAFHKSQYGQQGLIITAAGAIDHKAFHESVQKAFLDWPEKDISEDYPKSVTLADTPKKEMIEIKDKSKVDVTLGHAMPLKRHDELYYAAFLVNFILGGDFSARLSSTVRDEHGLTYTIYSDFSGIDHLHQGQWSVNIILNPDLIDRGLEETFKQLRLFHEKGVSDKELAAKKQTLKGRFKVSLSTTDGIASRLLDIENLGLGLDYLDRFADIIEGISPEQAKSAIDTYFHPDKLHTAIAGTLKESPQKS